MIAGACNTTPPPNRWAADLVPFANKLETCSLVSLTCCFFQVELLQTSPWLREAQVLHLLTPCRQEAGRGGCRAVGVPRCHRG